MMWHPCCPMPHRRPNPSSFISDEKSAEIADLQGKNNVLEADYLEVMNTIENQPSESLEIPETDIERGKIILYDSSVGYSWIPVISGIEKNTYKKENFAVDDRFRMTYTVDEELSSYFGIDVSSYQGDIDWQLVKEDGVEFQDPKSGAKHYINPEISMEIQQDLGSDIAMAFDECIENPAPYEYVKQSCERTSRWLLRCKDEMARLKSLPDTINPHQLLFGINQGTTYPIDAFGIIAI